MSKSKRKTRSGGGPAAKEAPTEPTHRKGERRDSWWGWLLVALLCVFVGYLVYQDVILDLGGVHGYGYVASAEDMSGPPGYVHRHHCMLDVWLPSQRQTSKPTAGRTPHLLRGARVVSLSVRAEPDDCRAYLHTWRRFRYLEDDPDDIRFAKDLGIVAKGLFAAALFALLFGIREAIRWVRRRLRRR